jgi:hypothetical protein
LALVFCLALPALSQSPEEDLATIRNYVKISDQLGTPESPEDRNQLLRTVKAH